MPRHPCRPAALPWWSKTTPKTLTCPALLSPLVSFPFFRIEVSLALSRGRPHCRRGVELVAVVPALPARIEDHRKPRSALLSPLTEEIEPR